MHKITLNVKIEYVGKGKDVLGKVDDFLGSLLKQGLVDRAEVEIGDSKPEEQKE